MTPGDTYDPLPGDDKARNAMATACNRLLEAIETGYGPQHFLWTEAINAKAWVPSEDPRDYRTTGYQRAMRSAADKESALARRVTRDPCRVCGTRADIGCGHQRVA